MDKSSRHSTHLAGYLKAQKQSSRQDSPSPSSVSASQRNKSGERKLSAENVPESEKLSDQKQKELRATPKKPLGIPSSRRTVTVAVKSRIKPKTIVEGLPDELLVKIFNWCGPSELLKCAQVCKRWEALTSDNILWRRVVKKFPKPVRDALPPIESEDVNWKKAIIERCIKTRDQKAMSLLKKVHQYTGLPAATQDVLKMFGIRWLLCVTDTSGCEHYTMNSDVFHFATSLSIRWYSFQFPPLSRIKSLKVYALTPIFYEIFSGKWKPQSNSSCKRSLVLELDLKDSLRLTASKVDGQDDLVTAHILPSGLLAAIYNASWKEGGDVAFISLCLHHNGIVKASLLGTRDRVYHPTPHKAILDDLDPMYGFHGYSATVEIRNHRTVYWGTNTENFSELFGTADISLSSLWDKAADEVCRIFGFPSLYSKQTETLRHFFSKRDVFVNLPTCYGEVNSSHLILRSFAHENGLFSKPLCLPWKTELFKSILQDMAILDITLLDEHKHLMWCASSPIKVVTSDSTEVNYTLDDGKRTFIKYEDEKGIVFIELAWMPEDEQHLVVKVEFRINISHINQWFGKNTEITTNIQVSTLWSRNHGYIHLYDQREQDINESVVSKRYHIVLPQIARNRSVLTKSPTQ